jgi:hypothetical protein
LQTASGREVNSPVFVKGVRHTKDKLSLRFRLAIFSYPYVGSGLTLR